MTTAWRLSVEAGRGLLFPAQFPQQLYCNGHQWVREIPDWSVVVHTGHCQKQSNPFRYGESRRQPSSNRWVLLILASSWGILQQCPETGASYRRFHQNATSCCQQGRGPRKGGKHVQSHLHMTSLHESPTNGRPASQAGRETSPSFQGPKGYGVICKLPSG